MLFYDHIIITFKWYHLCCHFTTAALNCLFKCKTRQREVLESLTMQCQSDDCDQAVIIESSTSSPGRSMITLNLPLTPVDICVQAFTRSVQNMQQPLKLENTLFWLKLLESISLKCFREFSFVRVNQHYDNHCHAGWYSIIIMILMIGVMNAWATLIPLFKIIL